MNLFWWSGVLVVENPLLHRAIFVSSGGSEARGPLKMERQIVLCAQGDRCAFTRDSRWRRGWLDGRKELSGVSCRSAACVLDNSPPC